MMTPYKPDVVLDARYSLKETAAILGVHPNTIRNYTKKNEIRAIYGKYSKWPRYTGAEILKFWEQIL